MRRLSPLFGAALILCAAQTQATPVSTPRPDARQPATAATAPRQPRITADDARQIPTTRPRARPGQEVLRTQGTADAAPVPADTARKARAFDTWTRTFRGRALAQGISGAVFNSAFEGVAYDPKVVERDRNQSEFTKTIWDYLDTAVSDLRVQNGKAALADHAATLARIEARFGVEPAVVVAIWGLESAYGTFRGSDDVVQSLATLAFDGRRGKFFEAQLVAALKILQQGDTDPRSMTGSWAGAMGHTQFIPTSYLTYAVDFDGDGARDIWDEDPTDALASTAAYLKRFGWEQGQPWGVEVSLPEGFDYASARRTNTKLPSEWAQLGVLGVDGAPVPDHGQASVLLPAGARGAAFLVFGNFAVIERYNTADAYVIGVGHLADRIAGGAPIRAEWPRGDRALTFDERKELQRRLTARGFDTKGIDGKIGPLTIQAVRDFQRDRGQAPDGYASLAISAAVAVTAAARALARAGDPPPRHGALRGFVRWTDRPRPR